jgi:hypothetical protein
MRGVIFTELLEMAEARFGYEALDKVLQNADLPHGGVYTQVGNYPCSELVAIVGALSGETSVPVPRLVHAYGSYLFGRFMTLYPSLAAQFSGTIDLLSQIESVIHREVRKLYPSAELPTFEVREVGPSHIELLYLSTRDFSTLALGLIDGCAQHFGETAEVHCEPVQVERGFAAHISVRVITAEVDASAAGG